MHLEVKTGLVGQAHDLTQNEANILDEERIDEGVNDLGVAISRMLIENDLVLHEEVRDIVVQIDSLGNCVDTYHLATAGNSETKILGRRVEGWVADVWLDLPAIQCLRKKRLSTRDIWRDGSPHTDLLVEKRVFVVNVEAVLEGRVFMARHLYEVFH